MNYRDFFKEEISNPIKGGKGDNLDLSKFDKKQVLDGLRVEREHTKNDKIALDIVRDHLKEDPNYYKKLKKAGLADELDNKKTNECIRDIPVDKVDKQTTPGTVYPEVGEKEASQNMVGCISNTANIQAKTEVDIPAKDPTPENHVTGTISNTPSNPAILPKANGGVEDIIKSVIPQDVTIDIQEAKKKEIAELNKQISNWKRGKKVEGYGGDPETDKKYVKGKRWTVTY
jgi:hypothetical protein